MIRFAGITANSDLAFDTILGNASQYDDKILERTKSASKYTPTFQSKTATGCRPGGRYSLADLDRGGGGIFKIAQDPRGGKEFEIMVLEKFTRIRSSNFIKNVNFVYVSRFSLRNSYVLGRRLVNYR